MTRALAIVVVIQAVLFASLGAVVLDMRAHNRVEELGGVNVWGYRGTELGRKQPGHVRIALFGGDLAFGWGVAARETLVNYVARLVSMQLNRPGQPSRPVTAIVLAARGMQVGEYAAWIDRFGQLDLDVICILPDEPGHEPGNGRFLPDRRSVVFASTGYSPILPLVVGEKAQQKQSAILGAAARVLDAADVQVASAPATSVDPAAALQQAIQTARGLARLGVVLVLPPRWNGGAAAPADDPRFRVVRLGSDPQMDSDALRLDGYHFSAGGHSRAGDIVAPAVLDIVDAPGRAAR